MGRAETSPRLFSSSIATLDSLGGIKPHIVVFPLKSKSPQIYHWKNLNLPDMITIKEGHELFNIQGRNTLQSPVVATTTPFDLETNKHSFRTP